MPGCRWQVKSGGQSAPGPSFPEQRAPVPKHEEGTSPGSCPRKRLTSSSRDHVAASSDGITRQSYRLVARTALRRSRPGEIFLPRARQKIGATGKAVAASLSEANMELKNVHRNALRDSRCAIDTARSRGPGTCCRRSQPSVFSRAASAAQAAVPGAVQAFGFLFQGRISSGLHRLTSALVLDAEYVSDRSSCVSW